MATERITIWKWLTGGILFTLGGGALMAADLAGAAPSLGASAHTVLREHAPPVRRIVVSIADRKLAIFEGGQLRRSFDVAVGKPSTPTPEGEFTIAIRVKNPTWYGPEGAVPPGPKNPVGTRWIGLSLKGYGIHGTNAPKSIGTAASKGCIRMLRDDVEDLFGYLREGDAVELVQEPTGLLARAFRPARKPSAAPAREPQLTAMRIDPPTRLAAHADSPAARP